MRCQKCKGWFSTNDNRRKYCNICTKANDHNTRTMKRQIHELNFIGVDGEGVLRPDGTHEYVLLSVGEKSLYNPKGEALTFLTIAEFLWQCYLDNPNSVFVGFYLGYDFTNWLKDLPEERAKILLSKEGIALRSRTQSGQNRVPFPVKYAGWEFDMLGMKRFKLRPQDSKSWMYICDTGAFFQTSLLNVINPKNWPDSPIVSKDEFEKVQLGKESRGTILDFYHPITSDLIAYNVLENKILSRLMNRYNKGLVNIGIQLNKKQWFGPGQAAQEWMNNIKTPTREDHENIIDPLIMEAGRAAYYGGWFEIFVHGHIPGLSHIYDINSAYPYIMSTLPCLLHGKWSTYTNPNDIRDNNNTNLTLVYGTIYGSNKWIGSAPHRTKEGRILRPQITKGWCWYHELKLAWECKLINKIDIELIHTYDPCDCPNPFHNLKELYYERLKLGKNTAEGKARKLVYNSAYGKCAQSIGAAKYANPIYASLITSGCRCMILNAIGSHPNLTEDVLMIATDGIAFKSEHPSLDLSENDLGKWSHSKASNLTLFMPGMYWDDSTRVKLAGGSDPTLKSRGVSAKALADQIAEIDDRFQNEFFPEIDLHINFSIVSPIQALARNKWYTAGLINLSSSRHIDSNPKDKRYPYNVILDRGMRRTIPYKEGPTLESTPYDKRFGMEMRELKEFESLSPDGDTIMLFANALGLK